MSSEDVFAERLLLAITNLSEWQKAEIHRQMEEEGIAGGLKAGIARLAGMNTPSLLSDMLSGRARGKRYQEALAGVLGVPLAWLHGEPDAEPPVWSRPPIEVYEDWLLELRRAWRDWFGQAGEGSLVRSLGGPLLGEETRWKALEVSDGERYAIAQRLLLAPHDQDLIRLIEGDWELVPFAVLSRVAVEMGVSEPSHPSLVEEGHRQAQEARKQQDWIVTRLTRRFHRYWLPPRLFQITRLALVGLKQQRAYQEKDVREIDDALELLWRQQLQQHPGRLGTTPPPAFVEETGRERWSDLAEIQARHPADADVDPADKYSSRLPWQPELD